MRIVTFTVAVSDKRIRMNANRVEAVSESIGADDTAIITTWSGSVFRVKGTLDEVLKTLWGESGSKERGSS